MKKKIWSSVTFLVLLLCCLCGTVKAASASISVQSSASTIIVGRTFNVTVTVSSDVALANWEYTLAYDNSKLELVSGTPYIMDMVTTTNVKSRSYNYTFRAKASGNASIYIQSAAVLSWDGAIGVSKGSRTVTLKTQQEIEASYSKNNYLSSLGVEGKEFPFDKDTLEYTVEMEPGTTKVNLVGAVEDRTATVEGLGEKEVGEGANRFEVKVTAQNGNVRTYVVLVNVKEYNPITVDVEGKSYRVVRKRSELTAPANYTETTVVINEEEVPAYTSEITKYTLVGLKDEEGNIGNYIYQEGIYTAYQEYTFQKIILYPMEAKEIPAYYKKTTVILNNQEITAYKIKASSSYALIYGMNVETGQENLYQYNSEENTLQIYTREESEILEKEKEQNQLIGLCLGGVCLFLILIIILLIIALCKKGKATSEFEPKHKKRKKKLDESVSE